MKPMIAYFAVATLASALPCAAQTNAVQGTPYAQLLQAARTLRVMRGPKPLSPQEKARVATHLANINELSQAGTEDLKNKNFVAAEDDYRGLIASTNDPDAYYGLGEALAGQGKTAEAIAAYRTAVYWPLNTGESAIAVAKSEPNKPNLRGCCGGTDAVGWMKCALLLSQTGQAEEARAIYKQAFPLVSDPNRLNIIPSFEAGTPCPIGFQAAVHLALGLLTNDTGNDRELAMSEFDQALRLAPEAAVTNYYYGYGWRRLDVKSALRTADAAPAKLALQKAAALGNDDIKKAAGEALQGLQ